MNNFFEGLANQNNAVVSIVSTEDTSALNASGVVKISKGIITLEISYWASVWKYRVDKYVVADDTDWEIRNTFISGVKVDNINKFNEGLANMGLSSVSKSLELTNDEIREQVYKAIDASPSLKAIFKNKRLYNALSIEEKRKITLEYAIENYGKNSYSAWELNNLGLSESSNTIPSLEQLIELKNKYK